LEPLQYKGCPHDVIPSTRNNFAKLQVLVITGTQKLLIFHKFFRVIASFHNFAKARNYYGDVNEIKNFCIITTLHNFTLMRGIKKTLNKKCRLSFKQKKLTRTIYLHRTTYLWKLTTPGEKLTLTQGFIYWEKKNPGGGDISRCHLGGKI
jgi:hypothetical protein